MFQISQRRANDKIENKKESVLLVVSEDYKTDLKNNLNDVSADHIIKAIEAQKCTGKSGEIKSVPAPIDMKADIVHVLVAEAEDTTEKLEALAGNIAGKLYRDISEATLYFLNDAYTTEQKSAFMLGFELRCYHFDHYRTTLEDDALAQFETMSFYDADYKALEAAYEDILCILQGVFTARDLVGEPANILYPESYAERCLELKKLGLKVTVLDEQKMAKEGMYSLLGVGQGSVRESKAVILELKNNKAKDAETLALVGKGVTFDTGGISLKPGRNMWDMIFDMGGSAAVVGTMVALAARGAKANIVGIIGLVENMPDGNAQRPGDVVKTMSGKTVEVLNTDAEGRLVLADIMTYVQKKYKPDAMIDLATLTGAVIGALGHEYAGLFSNNDELSNKIQEAGKISGDKVWPFPMGEAFSKGLKSRVADIANIASSPVAGSITAAEFLKHFVEDDLPWAHIDIAGTAWTSEDKPTNPKGGTGFGVRLLDRLVRTHYEG